jgi:hypothetical protein
MRNVIAILMLVPAPALLAADPPSATVTGQRGGRAITYGAGLETVMPGLVVALVGSSSVERDATKDSWEAGLKKEHVRIKFAKPHTITAAEDGKSYAATEILLVTVGEHDPDRLLVRCGDKYHAFGKYDGHLWVLLQTRYLAGDK